MDSTTYQETTLVRLSTIEDTVLPYLENSLGPEHVATRFKKFELQKLMAGRLSLTKSDLVEFFFPETSIAEPWKRAIVDASDLQGLVSVLLRKPELLSQIAKYGVNKFLDSIGHLANQRPVLVIPAHLGYPMGGGESFLLDNCALMCELGWENVWISYLDPRSGWNNAESETQTPFFLDVRRVGPPTKASMLKDFTEFQPDVVHSHGAMAQISQELCQSLRIPCLIGHHFWTGLVELGTTENVDILANIQNHSLFRPGSQVESAWPKHVIKYLASDFMRDVVEALGSSEFYRIIHPIPTRGTYGVNPGNVEQDPYVLLMNSHPKKGGYLLHQLVEGLKEEIKIKAVISETGSERFYDELRALSAKHKNLELVDFGNASDLYEGAWLVIVPSLVDETFGRVVYEAVMNGIPVASSSKGFIPFQLGESGQYLPEDPQAWVEYINEHFGELDLLKSIAQKQYSALRNNVSRNLSELALALDELLTFSPKNRVGLFTIWGDQGLGNQAREYARQLMPLGYKVDVFSFQSYLTVNQSLKFQQNPADWAIPNQADSVYYSLNVREEVSLHELRQFIIINNIGTLLVPEICWNVNWERLLGLRIPNLSVVGIPNIEIVRRSEVALHNLLNANFFPTSQCREILTQMNVVNGFYWPYSFKSNESPDEIAISRKKTSGNKKIKILHVAGANPVSRKNTPKVIEAFVAASRNRDDLELTITTLVPAATFAPKVLPGNVKVIESDLSRNEIEALYRQHDVSIQVSSHEGIGLGFHESIANGCPIISLDVAPHNEQVRSNVSGWLLSAESQTMHDNDESLVPSWTFEVGHLVRIISNLDKSDIVRLSNNCIQLHETLRTDSRRLFVISDAMRFARRGVFASYEAGQIKAPRSLTALLKLLTYLAHTPMASIVSRGLKLRVYVYLRTKIQRQSLESLR